MMRLTRQTLIRAALLVGGLLATQFVLFGPSLVGQKILLPLDILSQPGMYLSPAESAAWGPAWDPVLTDPVLEMEIDRRFAVAEVRAGRLPLWNPHEYCGQPFLAANQTAVFSPFRILDYLWPGTLVVAWDQVAKAMVAGIGAYFFFRVAMRIGFVPALFGAWIWPLCGYYIQWAGHLQSGAAAWLPWIFLFTDGTLRQPAKAWIAGLALATAASLISGHAATAAQVLLADGLFFLWRAFDLNGWKGLFRPGAATVIAGWILGAVISAPQTLPTLGYLQTSHRVQSRLSAGFETPPVGFWAIPQLFLPDFNGTTRGGNAYFGRSANQPESASTGYVGLITALVLAPLGISDRQRRSWLLFSLVLAIAGIGQIAGVPGIKNLYESFPLDILRQNRMVLATGWAILMAGVIGLEALDKGTIQWPRWIWLGTAVPLALGIWCLVRAISIPDALRENLTYAPVHIASQIISRFSVSSIIGFALCLLVCVIWLGIARRLHLHRAFFYVVALLALVEVIAMDYNVYPQSDPAKYYPPQQILTDLALALPGRVCGVRCFPSCLTELPGLLDVRGYDGADPARLTDLCYLTQLRLFANPQDAAGYLQDYYPAHFPSPITRLMNLRYLIFTGKPPPGQRPTFISDGYWVYEDRRCLPRVFVPKTIHVIDDQAARLRALAQPDFDPEAVAYAESPASPLAQPADGDASIVNESPMHVTIQFNMKTPGVIVLSDTWDPGWHASVNGTESTVFRVNHVFRGVLVPAGNGILQYDYQPASFYLGLKLAACAGGILLFWIAWGFWHSRLKNPIGQSA
jgi:hypothetical protein